MSRRRTKSKTSRHKAAVREGAGLLPQDWVATPEPTSASTSPADPVPAPLPVLEPTRPSITEDKRAQDRISQRELGKVAVALRLPTGEWVSVRLWDFSSIGFGIVHEPSPTMADPILARNGSRESSDSAGASGLSLREGDEVQLRIQVRTEERYEVWCKVRNIGPWRDATKIGLRRLDVGFPQAVNLDRRESFRLPLAPSLSLKARIRHPFLYGHWSPILVSDVNKSLGFSFLSQDPSILLFEGMELDIHFELASFRKLPFTGRVTWVHATRENEVKFGVECMDMDWRLQGGLCDYLLFSRSWTPSKLRAAGFRSNEVKGHLRFRTVKSMEDYAEVLHLRRAAYISASKRPEATTAEEMATPLDGVSRILMATHHGQLVGSLTFTFPSSEDTDLDSQMGFPGRKYPVHLPPKANMIEVSRLCVHHDYRGTDLLQGMFEHGLKHFLMSDRHWLITSATTDLLPIYERIGFTRLKASYRHPLLNNREHFLIIAHKSAFLWGLGINLLVWNSVFGDLVRYLLDRNLLALPGWTKAIIRAKLLLRPLARRITDSNARNALRKHLESLRRSRKKREAEARREALTDETSSSLEPPGSLYAHMEVEVPDPGKPEAEASGRD